MCINKRESYTYVCIYARKYKSAEMINKKIQPIQISEFH